MSSRQRSPAASKAAQPDATSVQRKPRVLLTGFDPFGGERLNPSWLAVQSLHGKQIAGHTVVAAQLPTVFGESLRVLRGLIERHQPSLVICLGQAGGRGAISLERVAINIDDAAMPDNAGALPVDEPVVAEGPTAYFSRLPIKAMLAALREAGLPADVSQTAGTFVCNHVFYGLMHDLATRPELKETRGGFIHVPWLPEQGKPHLPLADVVHGLRVAVRSAVMHLEDLVLRAGAVH